MQQSIALARPITLERRRTSDEIVGTIVAGFLIYIAAVMGIFCLAIPFLL